MSLTGRQFEQFVDALADAFPAEEYLERMVRFRLDRNLARLTTAASLDQKIFKLIERAESEGWTMELLTRARESRPNNAALLAFAQAFALTPVPVSAGALSLEGLVQSSSKLLDVTRWRERLGEMEGRVCRIEVPTNAGTVAGTGFLVGPDLVMTNHHVVEAVIAGEAGTDTADGRRALARDVVLRFDYKRLSNGLTMNPGTTFSLARDWLVDASPPSPVDTRAEVAPSDVPSEDELDYAILRVEDAPGDRVVGGKNEPGAPKRGFIVPPASSPIKTGAPVMILQHPDGAPLKLAIATEGVRDLNGNRTRVTYRASTLPGSSGAPCFTIDWELFAIHHAGDPSWSGSPRGAEYNRGIPLDTIRRRLERRGLVSVLGGG